MANVILEIDGQQVEHQIDEQGNATLNGEVKFTKDELDAMTAQETPANPPAGNEGGGTDDDIASFDNIIQASGITIYDQDEKPHAYNMDVEGIASYARDVHAAGYKEGRDKALEDLFQSNPDLYDMYHYKQTKGTLDGYSQRINYNSYTITDSTDEGTLYDIIYAAEIAQGKSSERAKKIAEYSKANESLKDDAEDSLNILKRIEESENAAREQAAIKAAQEQQAIEDRYFGITYDDKGREKVLNVEGSMYDLVVNKGTVGDLFIPAVGIKVKTQEGKEKQLTRKQIFDYMAKPVKEINGILYTQAQLDEYARMQNLQAATKQFLLNLAGQDSANTLINRAATAKAIKILKNNASGSSGKGTVAPSGEGTGKGKVVLPVS